MKKDRMKVLNIHIPAIKDNKAIIQSQFDDFFGSDSGVTCLDRDQQEIWKKDGMNIQQNCFLYLRDTKIYEVINKLYVSLLHRSIEDGGIKSYILEILGKTKTLKQIELDILNSAEYNMLSIRLEKQQKVYDARKFFTSEQQKRISIIERSDIFKGLRVRYLGPQGRTGYSNACKSYFYSLYLTGADITFGMIHLHNDLPNDLSDRDLVQLSRCRKIEEVVKRDQLGKYYQDSYDVVILHSVPDHWPTLVDQERKLNPKVKIVGLTVWETTKIHKLWIQYMSIVDMIITPCDWNTDVFKLDLPNKTIITVHNPFEPLSKPSPLPYKEPFDSTFLSPVKFSPLCPLLVEPGDILNPLEGSVVHIAQPVLPYVYQTCYDFISPSPPCNTEGEWPELSGVLDMYGITLDLETRGLYSDIGRDYKYPINLIKIWNQFYGSTQDSQQPIFYTINEWTERKNFEGLIFAFLSAFSEPNMTSRPCLFLKTCLIKNPDIRHYLATIRGDSTPNIYFDTRDVSDFDIASLHQVGKVYVSLCHSEGTGLGALEAVAYGNIVIMSSFGGQLDYLKGCVFYVSGGVENPHMCSKWHQNHVKCPDEYCVYYPWYIKSEQQWGAPFIPDAIRIFRYVEKRFYWLLNNIHMNIARDYVASNFSYKQIGEQFATILVDLTTNK